ncbi:rhomboid family intramembrane serine protease [Streptomyces sp. 4N509B]|uniref:rhomboid family intramembrane serine protease n=1 Tax=Streptomyces sp. 4N509B TaxID=3457413 RepID=UPI003FD38381
MTQQHGHPTPEPGVATCYRHPDRTTAVGCSRCERPICPSCMIAAPVGHQCPECVHGAATVRAVRAAQPRTIAGATVTSDTALVTTVILGINAVVFLAALIGGDRFVTDFDMIGYAWDPLTGTWTGVAAGEWWRLLTSAFLHQEIWHIALNMLALWFLGRPLEGVLGRTRYVALYLISGLAGSTLEYVLAAQNQPALGASGAIFGLFGATAVLMRRLNQDMRPVAVLLGINLVITFAWSNISWEGHIGGLVAGTAIAYAMVHAPARRRTLVQVAACAVVLLVILVACLVRTAQLL